MAQLTATQIAQLATNVGIPQGQPMYTCVSIAFAESGGRTDADNSGLNSDGTVDKGVWQINTVHDATLPGQDRFDPNVNAQLMKIISNGGTNWQPWSTYNNGAYLAQMGKVMGELGGKSLTPGATDQFGAGSGAGNGLTQVGGANGGALLVQDASFNNASFGDTADVISKFFKILTSTEGWLRIMKVGIGLQLAIGGVVVLMATSQTAKDTAGAVAKVAMVIPK